MFGVAFFIIFVVFVYCLMEVYMFGGATFSEISFSETTDVESVFIGSLPIIYFNSSVLTFPLKINQMSHFSLDINLLQEYDLSLNGTINFTMRR